jgi:hypothetical protein
VRACARLSGVRARQFLGEELLSGKDRLRVEMRNAAAPFERFEGDTGSSEVQGAQSHPQLFSSALQHMSHYVLVGRGAPRTSGSPPSVCLVSASDRQAQLAGATEGGAWLRLRVAHRTLRLGT